VKGQATELRILDIVALRHATSLRAVVTYVGPATAEVVFKDGIFRVYLLTDLIRIGPAIDSH
jgi:hypothetical protein